MLNEFRDNYLKDLSQYTDRLYRETNPYKASGFINSFGGSPGELFFSNDIDLAKGQPGNQGVLMEFDPKGIQGQVNTSKPGWEMAYKKGSAEFIGKHTPLETYNKNLNKITILDNDILKTRDGKILARLLNNSPKWIKSVSDKGLTTYTKRLLTALGLTALASPYAQAAQMFNDTTLPVGTGEQEFLNNVPIYYTGEPLQGYINNY